jgi:hypothetical protein
MVSSTQPSIKTLGSIALLIRQSDRDHVGCDRAAPVTGVAIVVDNLPLTDIGDNLVIGGDGHEKEGAVYGAVKLLGEFRACNSTSSKEAPTSSAIA